VVSRKRAILFRAAAVEQLQVGVELAEMWPGADGGAGLSIRQSLAFDCDDTAERERGGTCLLNR